ncbi:esterase-like activity of phytase family protein [Sphingomonas sp. GCM10030256]|uniref:esterase-like activity of phytase family protein n=1 Tax=Sphingomonas sp. GCM10030256 TaxID=3273427 RepID=UPI00361C2493
MISISFEPLAARPPLAGLWRVRGETARLGGVSALAIRPDGLRALTDSGVLIDLPYPAAEPTRALVRDLPAGPGRPTFKKFRDSESLSATGSGWWVGFEHRHSLWLFDPAVRHARGRTDLSRLRWPVNAGAEAMVADGDGLLLLSESGREVVRVRSGRVQRLPLRDAGGAPADATRLPDGTVLVTVRRFGITGIRNRIARLERSSPGYRLRPVAALPLGPFDNVEGLAAQPRPGGGVRLWMITDNDLSRVRDTLLIALDLPGN